MRVALCISISPVIHVKAGIQGRRTRQSPWTPAFAGRVIAFVSRDAFILTCHPRESGDPGQMTSFEPLDSRFRGNDNEEGHA
jgi:hypothetical protein